MAAIELGHVQRLTGGRIHLAPNVPSDTPAVTLCGRTLPAGAYRPTDAEVDCQSCLRRRADPSRISTAFFQSDAGSELLQRSLEQAQARRAQRPAAAGPPAEAPPASAPRRRPEPPPPPTPPRIAELRSGGPLRRTFENVYVSPEGVLVRVSDGRVQHVTFNGPTDVRRRGRTLVVRIGDLVLEFDPRT